MLNQCEFDFGWNGLQIEGRAQSMGSGKWIESLRKERRIKSKDVERMSRAIAESKGDHNFYIPHSTLCGIETGAIPSIHKLFSLAICLGVSLPDLLLAFGIECE